MTAKLPEGAIVHVVGSRGERALLGSLAAEVLVHGVLATQASATLDVEVDQWARLKKLLKDRESKFAVECEHMITHRQKQRPEPSPYKCARRRNANKQARASRRRNRK